FTVLLYIGKGGVIPVKCTVEVQDDVIVPTCIEVLLILLSACVLPNHSVVFLFHHSFKIVDDSQMVSGVNPCFTGTINITGVQCADQVVRLGSFQLRE